MNEEEGTGGVLASNEDLIAQYQTTRIRGFLFGSGYKRLVFFCFLFLIFICFHFLTILVVLSHFH